MFIASVISLVSDISARWQKRRERRSRDRKTLREMNALPPHIRQDLDWPKRDRAAENIR